MDGQAKQILLTFASALASWASAGAATAAGTSRTYCNIAKVSLYPAKQRFSVIETYPSLLSAFSESLEVRSWFSILVSCFLGFR